MMSYSEMSTHLALEASIAVFVLSNPEGTELELLPLKPHMADAQMLADLKARWPGRNLDSIGVMGLVGTTPKVAFKRALEPEQVSALAGAFLSYLNTTFHDSFAALFPFAQIAEPRTEPEYDWLKQRYV